MLQIVVYNTAGEKAGSAELDETVFGVSPKKDVVHQVYLAHEANARQPWAHSKDKSEVRGGGKKPWKQKGTGRARHGSIRSPIWKGGGVTFGPLNTRNYKQKINKKMNKLALRMCLSEKLLEEKMILLEEYKGEGKTKQLSEMRAKMPGNGKTTLLVGVKKDGIGLEARNISKLDVQRAEDINIVDVLHHQYVILTKNSIKILEKRLKV
ncbi:MAG: 50S ribosomal protein L4 [Candidatus Magasanikbacteria bacterium CG_4_10_14_0_2_um_filter_37_12]|uniref:Large ribosomal subunit protein uL4 n=1 Tax=Candidatus Magasanikbacteria bacterium CG_4_10_14_0_2_um_filter_37_12 TaxID=1974637 RepID=A0A2M7V8Q2_9BACT|nr:MAG: 50S ribosomal protein L4 [Candidatus Magasanikbacteria bacterium CG_4_10_14_0_2_um_filter_37_12]